MHRGYLRIEGRAPDGLCFLDREGRDLDRQHRLDVAHWLDIWLGWRGREWDSQNHMLPRYSPEEPYLGFVV